MRTMIWGTANEFCNEAFSVPEDSNRISPIMPVVPDPFELLLHHLDGVVVRAEVRRLAEVDASEMMDD